jgi:hypothetical protein
MHKALIAALAALAFGACGGVAPTGPASSGGSPGPCPTGGGSAVIDWVDFVVIGEVHYNSQDAYGYELTKADLGPEITRTRCMMSDRVSDPEYQIQDGDAGYLPPGTPIYELKGYDPSFRVVARSDGELRIYESDSDPDAAHGSDIMDLAGKVDYIGVNSVRDGRTELAAIRDPEEVRSLVEMVLGSPVDQDRFPADNEMDDQVFVAFHLDDGSITARAFYPTSRILARGIIVPQEFSDAIVEAKEGS